MPRRPLAVALLPVFALHLVATRLPLPVALLAGTAVGLLLWTQRPALPTWAVALWSGAAGAAGMVIFARRYAQARGAERRRLQWFGLAVAVVTEVVVVAAIVRVLTGWPSLGPVALVASLLVPVALVLSASERMHEHLDWLVTDTVAMLSLTAVVAVAFGTVVFLVGRPPTDRERSAFLLFLVATAAAAAAYVPARRRLGELANRLIYGERLPPEEVLRTFGSRSSRAIPLDELLMQAAESLRQIYGLAAVEIWTGSDGRLDRTVSLPETGSKRLVLSPDEMAIAATSGIAGAGWVQVWLPEVLEGRQAQEVRVAAASHGGQLFGIVVAVREASDPPFVEEEERVLTELARQLAGVLHNVQLDSALQASLVELRATAEELRASRARIVVAADTARRQIERDLHDGAQAHLIALAVNVRVAEQLAERDPRAAKEIISELGQELRDAVQQLRELAHGIYPSVLMDRGLGDALAAVAQRGPLPVHLNVPADRRYPREVEAAVYFCCLEAVQNAGKHAGPSASATISIREEAGGLLFEVADNGVGFDSESGAGAGSGFQNMADRLGAIGGSVHVWSRPGEGVRVSGRVPLAPTRADSAGRGLEPVGEKEEDRLDPTVDVGLL